MAERFIAMGRTDDQGLTAQAIAFPSGEPVSASPGNSLSAEQISQEITDIATLALRLFGLLHLLRDVMAG